MLYTREATIDRCHTLSICLHIKGRAPVSGIHICYAALSIGKTNLRRSDFTNFPFLSSAKHTLPIIPQAVEFVLCHGAAWSDRKCVCLYVCKNILWHELMQNNMSRRVVTEKMCLWIFEIYFGLNWCKKVAPEIVCKICIRVVWQIFLWEVALQMFCEKTVMWFRKSCSKLDWHM